MSMVYMVVMGEDGGLFGVYYDPHRAREAAKAIDGAVAEMPILWDYRPTTWEQQP